MVFLCLCQQLLKCTRVPVTCLLLHCPSAWMFLSVLLVFTPPSRLSSNTHWPVNPSLSLLHGHRSSTFRASHTFTNQRLHHILLAFHSPTCSSPLRTKSVSYCLVGYALSMALIKCPGMFEKSTHSVLPLQGGTEELSRGQRRFWCHVRPPGWRQSWAGQLVQKHWLINQSFWFCRNWLFFLKEVILTKGRRGASLKRVLTFCSTFY